MKKMLVFLLSTLLVVSLCACGAGGANGSGGATAGTSSETAVETGGEDDQILVSDPIDFTLDEGNVKYVGFEKADPNLTDEENVLVFVFEFTNYQDKPAAVQEKFWISFFQNGAELSKSVSYSGKAKEQYELVHSFYDTALKGGTVTFGMIVVPEDNSPITIMVNKQGDSDTYQLSEVVIDPDAGVSEEEKTAEETVQAVSVEDIKAALQGTWEVQGGQFVFDGDSITILAGNNALQGTYEIDPDMSEINARVQATDGSVALSLPFEYRDGKLTLWNNQGTEVTKIK